MDIGSTESSQAKIQSCATGTNNQKGQVDDVRVTSEGAINMEASVTADEVVRAGGFGATDDIGHVLPVAGDSTDIEDHFRNIQGYEDAGDDKAGGQQNDNLKHGDVADTYVDSDDVTRAGGYGATDNISNFLPVASDFTDFEASLRDARDYEDLKEEIARPGLGWTNETNFKQLSGI
ncbi:uncharacterized protein LOC127264132 [Andrographis paniculata]|uniref:uncharacterized protein LOC127264132 n=1 Tax=Andrographis paniculata TaxID=175694 RepID=UPI0021E8AA28|nr:uncharacterized protein LOC127264132 [Andrographis paniculata]